MAARASASNNRRPDTSDRQHQQQQREDDEDIDSSSSSTRDYLLSLCTRLFTHVSKTSAAIVSKNNNCEHYARSADLLNKIYRIAAACVRNLVFAQDWDAACVSMGARGRQPNEQSVFLSRKFLIRTVLEHGEKISYNYRIAGKDNRLCDNIMMIIFTLDVVQFYLNTDSKRKEIQDFVADNDPWLTEHNITIASDASSVSEYRTPVLRYRMSQLTGAMYQLAAAWNTTPYSIQLVHYLELLRIRIGQLLNLTFSGKVHDVEALRVSVSAEELSSTNADGEYQASPLFLATVAPVICEMMRVLATFAAHKLAGPEQLAKLRGKRNFRFLIKRFDAWIASNIRVMIPEGSSEKMSQYLLNMSLRPGERQVFSRESPSNTNLSDVQFILGKYRKIEFNHLCELKQKTFAQVIEKELPKQVRKLRPGRPGYESVQLVLCLVELIEMYTKAKYFMQVNLMDFIVFELSVESRATDFRYVEEPIMVQMFNYFQLYYRGVLYRFDSFILSFIAWLKVLEQDFGRKLRGCDISNWYADILEEDPEAWVKGKGVSFWEAPSLFGSDDEDESSDSDDDNGDEEGKEVLPSAGSSGRDQAALKKKKKNPATAEKPKDPLAIKSVM